MKLAVAATAAFVAGAASVAGYAPYSLPLAIAPAPLFALAVLYGLMQRAERPAHAALLGGWWGLGCFLAGVSWVYVSMARFSGLPAAAAAVATFAFCAYLASYPALACAVFTRLRPRSPLLAAITFGAAWSTAEWLRGQCFTGFPWLAIGYAHTPPSPLAGYAPVAGVFGVGMAAATMSGWLVAVVTAAGRRARVGAGLALLGVAGAGALLAAMTWTTPAGDPLAVSLLQGDVPQDVKWDPTRLQFSFDRYAQLVDAPREDGATPAPPANRLLVLPETAIPLLFEDIPRDYLARLTSHGAVLIGSAVRHRADGYVNAAVGLTADAGAPVQAYAKRHLVPFGEYPPPGFRWFFDALRIPMSEFAAGPPDQPVIELAGQRIAPNICYEDLFGEELLAGAARATLLINLSNTAWFGDSLAQPQHLQISRLRALETGRPMLRATNSGLTAIISPRGEVLAWLPAFRPGRLDALVQGTSGLTPYAKWGNALALALAAAVLLASALARRRQPPLHHG